MKNRYDEKFKKYEYFQKVIDVYESGDNENAHGERDRILIGLLRKYNPKAAKEAELIEQEIGFWYA